MIRTCCPRCHNRSRPSLATLTVVRAWVLCIDCGNIWSYSSVRFLASRWLWNKQGTPARTPPQVEHDQVDVRPREGLLDLCEPELFAGMESWVRASSESVSEPDGARAVVDDPLSAWLDSDPFEEAPRRIPAEAFRSQRQPAPRIAAVRPSTFTERLDMMHQGLMKLEAFVANCARREEAAASMFDADVPKNEPAPIRRSTVLRFRAG